MTKAGVLNSGKINSTDQSVTGYPRYTAQPANLPPFFVGLHSAGISQSSGGVFDSPVVSDGFAKQSVSNSAYQWYLENLNILKRGFLAP